MNIYEEDYINAKDVDYETIYENSHKPGKHKNKRQTVTIRKSIFNKALAIMIAMSIGIGAFGGTYINNKIDDFSAERMLSGNINDFHITYVAPNTHRTEDNEHYWYDTDKIADYVFSTKNPDEMIYYCYQDMGPKTAGEIVQHNGYDNFLGYVSDKGFESVDNYEDQMHDNLITKYRLSDEENELEQMTKDTGLQILDEENTKGVK